MQGNEPVNEPWYCTREDVKSSLDVKLTARSDVQVDAAIESASRTIDKATHRKFFPSKGTRYLDWPAKPGSYSWRLWLGQHELASTSAAVVTSGGNTLSSTDYWFRPDDGPPFTRLELDKDSAASFGQGSTEQRDIAIASDWFGYSADTQPAGALAEALDTSETSVDVTDSSVVGVGDLITVDSERMIVTGKQMLTSGQSLQADIDAQAKTVTVAVTTGTGFHVGEVLLLDSERMLVVDIAGNNLTVKRAWDGTVLAAHTGSTIYAARTLTVERGSVGTTTAAHDTAAAVTRNRPPAPITALCRALSVDQVLQELGGYSRTVGSGDNEREASGRALAQAWKRADSYRRQRQGAI